MKRILYIGNKLTNHGYTATNIETLGPLLANEGIAVRYASSVKSKPLRLLDMIVKTLRHGFWSHYILIDTYSTSNFWYAFAVSQLARMMRRKYIPILHGGELPRRLERNPKLCRAIFGHAHINVAPSRYLETAFSAAGFNVVHIPNTIETKNYTFQKRRQVAPSLFWVRSFSPIYNPEMALAVFAKLRTTYPEAALCMVGPDKEGHLEKVKRSAKNQGLPVQFTGRLSKSEWTKLSASFDVFINTTHFDNMPVSVIEAMALGMPIVSTNVGGIPFLLEHEQTALLVGDADTDAMVNAIKRLLSEPDLVARLTQNAAVVASGFDFEQVKHQWAEVLI
ncbi:glycosyltransferase family 4 protein [Flavobacterium caeni]|uniref:Glycosyltransferase involved in cell wall bisynthesis n=1 Tax=Flavobacterium caeni TaxID=490189 RepID=A0A1G5FNJ7_9FLAO|nr:glycosyltransferase family 4 protein [Flavobacterium caeni]SCY40178.1 Glycosyltransferase involved in cell wall bisynthesis [Flavobacterium caeni]